MAAGGFGVDLTGDGLTDVGASMVGEAGVAVFTGPHAVSRESLDGAAATWTLNLGLVGDADGDGDRDFIQTTRDSNIEAVYLSPVAGDLDTATPALSWSHGEYGLWGADRDGDGITDAISVEGGEYPHPGKLLLHSGPYTEWAGPARATFVMVESPEDDEYCTLAMTNSYLHAEDLDGDGRGEPMINDGIHPTCPQTDGWVLPADFAGEYKFERDTVPAGWVRYDRGSLIPDQTGDGVPDTLYFDEGYGIYDGPMAAIDGVMAPSGPRVVDLGDEGLPANAQPISDVDGDGIVDWLSAWYPAETGTQAVAWARVYRGGVEGLSKGEVLRFWAIWFGSYPSSPSASFVPEENLVLLQGETDVAVLDLAP